MAGSNKEALLEWFQKRLEDFDFDGDTDLEIVKGLLQSNEDLTPRRKWDDFRTVIMHSSSEQFRKEVRAQVEIGLSSEIYGATSVSELRQINPKKLTTRLARARIFREKGYSLPAEDIRTMFGGTYPRTLKFYAKFYELSEDEARAIFAEKGITLDKRGRIK